MLDKTGIRHIYKQQLACFGEPDRDSRGHIVSLAYWALVDQNTFLQDVDLARVQIRAYDDLTPGTVAYDHGMIITSAHMQLDLELESTNVIRHILPEDFTLGQIQNMYELILGVPIDKRNFRKKILSSGLIDETGGTTQEFSYRPAKLYAFTSSELQRVSMV